TEEGSLVPRTVTEELLASIYSAVLGIERIGVEADFFAMGGHSLLATQVIARIRAAFKIDLSLRTIFETPTIAELATRIENVKQAGSQTQLPAIVPVARDEALALSFGQERLWFLDQLEPGNVAYSIPTALRLHGTLDVNALQRALEELVRR